MAKNKKPLMYGTKIIFDKERSNPIIVKILFKNSVIASKFVQKQKKRKIHGTFLRAILFARFTTISYVRIPIFNKKIAERLKKSKGFIILK